MEVGQIYEDAPLRLCQKPGGASDIILPRTIHTAPKVFPSCFATPWTHKRLNQSVGADQLQSKQVKISDPAAPPEDPEDESRHECSRIQLSGKPVTERGSSDCTRVRSKGSK